MNDRMRLLLLDSGVAVAIAAALLLALELFSELDDVTMSSARWQLLVLIIVGGGLTVATFSDRVPARPLLMTAALLAWPLFSFVSSVPGPPSWIPLLRDSTAQHARQVSLAVGVLGAGAWLRRP